MRLDFGGSSLDEGNGITYDGGGNVIIVRRAYSNFPVGACYGNTAFQTSPDGTFGDMDMFIVKLYPIGTNRLWSTYFGRPKVEQVYHVEVDAADNVIAVGNAWANFPTTFGTTQPSFGGGMGDTSVVQSNGEPPIGNLSWREFL